MVRLNLVSQHSRSPCVRININHEMFIMPDAEGSQVLATEKWGLTRIKFMVKNKNESDPI
jgi:hypothetical protein